MYKDLRIIHTFYCISHHCLRHYLRLPEWRNHVPVLPILWTGYSLVLPLAQAHPLDARIASIKRTPAWEFSHRTREASPKITTRPYTKKDQEITQFHYLFFHWYDVFWYGSIRWAGLAPALVPVWGKAEHHLREQSPLPGHGALCSPCLSC